MRPCLSDCHLLPLKVTVGASVPSEVIESIRFIVCIRVCVACACLSLCVPHVCRGLQKPEEEPD